ncbi:cytochrome b/b6 domain-containing protein [Methylovirgula sp. HY1]|uniref:cytochrome b/b6 domain-containing protein n=1 Tax=Methylovirgula sp. HY1 TaxID=2822761 RepID=UPI001C5AF105|nr:cytochrome b/b6 domain-containing protein [Methylovirgula sp. HY1]
MATPALTAIKVPGAQADAMKAMRAVRSNLVELHEYVFYGLIVLIAVHICAVVITEVRERGNIISAMFTSKKLLTREPTDAD